MLARFSFATSWYGYSILTSGILVAWLFLIWIAWVRNLHLSKVIPIVGTVLASIGLSPFLRGFDQIILLALPAFFLQFISVDGIGNKHTENPLCMACPGDREKENSTKTVQKV